ncbi:MAG: Uma2 family endonuclease [Dehalococcoidia bacterium]
MAAALVDAPVKSRVPPLVAGDNLTRDEFERIWALHPEIKRAERLNGIVYLEMSVSPDHGVGHSHAHGWLFTYVAGRPELEIGDNTTVRLGDDDLQPDLYLRRKDAGTSTRTSQAINGPPELIFEVAVSSAAYDLHQKREIYERGGVQEYIVWQLFDQRLDWLELAGGRYRRREPDSSGVIESSQFPGLRLHVPSLLHGDIQGLLAGLNG